MVDDTNPIHICFLPIVAPTLGNHNDAVSVLMVRDGVRIGLVSELGLGLG